MSSASSNQSIVRDGADYDEVYPLGHKDANNPSEERSPSTSSSRDEDSDMERSKGDSSDDLMDVNPPIQSVIGLDGLREFILLPLWTDNDFISKIKELHFKTLRDKYQMLVRIPMRLPYKSKKCYYEGLKDIGIYEQMLKAGLRFPLSTHPRRLLQYLGLSVNQISPNAWRVFLSVEVLYGAMSDRARRLTVEKFFCCYRPVEVSQFKGMYNFTPKSPLLRLIYENPNSNKDWKSCYFFLEGGDWMCHLGDNKFMPIDKIWGIMPLSGMRPSTNIYFCFNFSSTYNFPSSYATRDRPPVSLEQFSFLEKIFNKTKLKDRTWAKLVNLDTLY